MNFLMRIQEALIALLKKLQKLNDNNSSNTNTKEDLIQPLEYEEVDLDNIQIEVEEIVKPNTLITKESITLPENTKKEKETKQVEKEEEIEEEKIEREEPIIISSIRKAAKDKGYIVFEDNSKDYNLNIWFVRSVPGKVDSFDDKCYIFWKDLSDEWQIKEYQVTTDPGAEWLKKLGNKKGTAILVPDQYRSTHKLDIHKRGSNSAHKALCQRLGAVKVYRDSNRDSVVDMDINTKDKGWFGINFHRPTIQSQKTGKVSWSSAGCIVSSNRKEFDTEIIPLLEKAEKNWGNSFSITLVLETDLS